MQRRKNTLLVYVYRAVFEITSESSVRGLFLVTIMSRETSSMTHRFANLILAF